MPGSWGWRGRCGNARPRSPPLTVPPAMLWCLATPCSQKLCRPRPVIPLGRRHSAQAASWRVAVTICSERLQMLGERHPSSLWFHSRMSKQREPQGHQASPCARTRPHWGGWLHSVGASAPAAQAHVPRLITAVCLPPRLSGSLHQLFPREASWPCVNQSEGV